MAAAHKNKMEKQQLLSVIAKYEPIVNLKKADPKTISAKRKAWTQVANEYNQLPNIRPCNANQIKRFWSNLKARDVRVKKERVGSMENESNSLQLTDGDDDDELFLDGAYESADNSAIVEQPRIQREKNHLNLKVVPNRQQYEIPKTRNDVPTSTQDYVEIDSGKNYM